MNVKRTLKEKDIKKYRENCLQRQFGIDPITRLKIESPTADHDHQFGNMRSILDSGTNQLVGKIEQNYRRFVGYKKGVPSLTMLLLEISNYLIQDYSNNPLHPKWCRLQIRKFSRLNKITQDGMLIHRGIKPGKTSTDRTKQLKNWFYER